MIRFLRQNAEIITSICVVLSLIIGGSFLYQSQQAQAAGQAELDAVLVSESPKAAKPAATAPSPVNSASAASTSAP